MIKLDSGNVLLKPTQRRQLMAWLRRALKLGSKVGDFVLNITLHRAGRAYEARASVHDAAGDFGLRRRGAHWRDALRDLARALSNRLHAQVVNQAR